MTGIRYAYGLTERELRVARMLAQGAVSKTIVRKLETSRRAIDEDRRAIRLKTSSDTTAQAMVVLAKAGVV